jgi:hypothetical protein
MEGCCSTGQSPQQTAVPVEEEEEEEEETVDGINILFVIRVRKSISNKNLSQLILGGN